MLDTKTNFVNEKVEIDPKDLQVSFDNNTTEITLLRQMQSILLTTLSSR